MMKILDDSLSFSIHGQRGTLYARKKERLIKMKRGGMPETTYGCVCSRRPDLGPRQPTERTKKNNVYYWINNWIDFSKRENKGRGAGGGLHKPLTRMRGDGADMLGEDANRKPNGVDWRELHRFAVSPRGTAPKSLLKTRQNNLFFFRKAVIVVIVSLYTPS